MTPNYTEKETFRVVMRMKARAEFISTAEEHYRQFLYQTIDMVTNFICNRFQQKNCIETFKIIENLLLKVLREEDLGLELLSFLQ